MDQMEQFNGVAACKFCIQTVSQNVNQNVNQMIKDKFFFILHDNFKNCYSMLDRKNQDYVHQDPDPFVNFRNPKLKALLDKLDCVHPDDVEVAIFEQISIKFNRIANLLFSTTPPSNERLDDSLDDIMNYSNLLRTYRQMYGTLKGESSNA